MSENTKTPEMEVICNVCMQETSRDPIVIIRHLMEQPFCHMHGPEHHMMVGAALLTAYHNAGGKVDLSAALNEICQRGKAVPGAVCGYWGACGAGISTGMFISIITGSGPLAQQVWPLPIRMTAKALENIGSVGGPRCCKRDSYLAILSAIDYVKEHFGVEMAKSEVTCIHSHLNKQCIGSTCPFAPKRPAFTISGKAVKLQ